jgi:hypothetical protein
MKIKRTDYSLYEIPELEETESVFSFSTRPRIEDANDNGCTGDSISFAMDFSDDCYDA